jgi:hypothetical protein
MVLAGRNDFAAPRRTGQQNARRRRPAGAPVTIRTEALMASAFTTRRYRFALGTTLALAATTAFAEAPAQQVNAPETIVVAQAAGTSAGANTGSMTYAYPPLEAGVRKAAAEGPEALRWYIHRTRMIYAWYYPDFVL